VTSSPTLIEAFLASFGETGLSALKIVISYVKDRNERFGKNSLCVTYEGLRKYITYRKLNIRFTTLERAMRKLAEGGVLRRRKVGKKDVVFCLNQDHPIVWYLMNEVG